MPLKNADTETLQQHIDALHIITNLILTEMANSNPQALRGILTQLRQALDSSPQLHPTLHDLLEQKYMTFQEQLTPKSAGH